MVEYRRVKLIKEFGSFKINYSFENSNLIVYFVYNSKNKSEIFKKARVFAKDLSLNLNQEFEECVK